MWNFFPPPPHFRCYRLNLGLVVCLWGDNFFGTWIEVEYQATVLKMVRFTFPLSCLVLFLTFRKAASYPALLVFWPKNPCLNIKADEKFVGIFVLWRRSHSHYWESAFFQLTKDWINKDLKYCSQKGCIYLYLLGIFISEAWSNRYEYI